MSNNPLHSKAKLDSILNDWAKGDLGNLVDEEPNIPRPNMLPQNNNRVVPNVQLPNLSSRPLSPQDRTAKMDSLGGVIDEKRRLYDIQKKGMLPIRDHTNRNEVATYNENINLLNSMRPTNEVREYNDLSKDAIKSTGLPKDVIDYMYRREAETKNNFNNVKTSRKFGDWGDRLSSNTGEDASQNGKMVNENIFSQKDNTPPISQEEYNKPLQDPNIFDDSTVGQYLEQLVTPSKNIVKDVENFGNNPVANTIDIATNIGHQLFAPISTGFTVLTDALKQIPSISITDDIKVSGEGMAEALDLPFRLLAQAPSEGAKALDKTGAIPTDKEIANYLGVSKEKVSEVASKMTDLNSLASTLLGLKIYGVGKGKLTSSDIDLIDLSKANELGRKALRKINEERPIDKAKSFVGEKLVKPQLKAELKETPSEVLKAENKLTNEGREYFKRRLEDKSLTENEKQITLDQLNKMGVDPKSLSDVEFAKRETTPKRLVEDTKLQQKLNAEQTGVTQAEFEKLDQPKKATQIGKTDKAKEVDTAPTKGLTQESNILNLNKKKVQSQTPEDLFKQGKTANEVIEILDVKPNQQSVIISKFNQFNKEVENKEFEPIEDEDGSEIVYIQSNKKKTEFSVNYEGVFSGFTAKTFVTKKDANDYAERINPKEYYQIKISANDDLSSDPDIYDTYATFDEARAGLSNANDRVEGSETSEHIAWIEKYKRDALTDDFEIDDNFEINDNTKTIEGINESSDRLLSDVESYFGGKYTELPETITKSNETRGLRLRIADHSGNKFSVGGSSIVVGGDRPDISIVIANKDATGDRFGNSDKQLSNEYYFDSDTPKGDIIKFIKGKAKELSEEFAPTQPTEKAKESQDLAVKVPKETKTPAKYESDRNYRGLKQLDKFGTEVFENNRKLIGKIADLRAYRKEHGGQRGASALRDIRKLAKDVPGLDFDGKNIIVAGKTLIASQKPLPKDDISSFKDYKPKNTKEDLQAGISLFTDVEDYPNGFGKVKIDKGIKDLENGKVTPESKVVEFVTDQKLTELNKKGKVEVKGQAPVTKEMFESVKKGMKEQEVTDFFKSKQKDEKTAKTPPRKKELAVNLAINDFGEKIGGAKKDYHAKLTKAKELDAKKEPLSKVFPTPNYAKLIETGADKKTIAWVRALRDLIPTKPKQSYRVGKLDRYVSEVEIARNTTENLLSGKTTLDEVKEFTKDTNSKVNELADLYEAVGHTTSLKGYRLRDFSDSGVAGGKKWLITKGNRIIADGETKSDVLSKFKTKLDNKKPSTTKFDIWQMRGKKGFYIGKKVAPGKYITLKSGISTLKEAREFLRGNQDKLETDLAKHKYTPNERRSENRDRIGKDYRQGKDVTPDKFQESFGFRGVEFGNWISKGGERQKSLNRAYDALHDLSNILGIPTQAISLNGELGLAFGSRGSGGKNPAAAHYEPGKVVINLTRKNGAGSLAHEWFHALDNYFSRKGGRTLEYTTDNPELAKVRPEVADAFVNLQKALKNTDIYKRSNELDKTRSKKYWGQTIEVSARSFESYVIDKLDKQGGISDYLANVREEKSFITDMLKAIMGLDKNATDTYPYLTESEIPEVSKAFDNLFNVLETQRTDKGTELYQAKTKPLSTLSKKELDTELSKVNSYMPKWVNIKLDDKIVDGNGKPALGSWKDGEISINPKLVNATTLPHEITHQATKMVFAQQPYRGRVLLKLNGWDGKGDPLDTKNENVKDAWEGIAKKGESYLRDEDGFMKSEPHAKKYKRFFDKLKELWESVRNWLKGSGFASESKLFNDMAKGKFKDYDIVNGNSFALAQKLKDAFYSKVEQLIGDKAPNKNITKEQLLPMLEKNGAKKAELEWLDIESFLEDNPKATKQELLDYVKANNVKLEVVEKGNLAIKKDYSIRQDGDVWDVMEEGKYSGKTFDTEDEAEAYISTVEPEIDEQTKFQDYQLHNGENYREVLVKMPTNVKKKSFKNTSDAIRFANKVGGTMVTDYNTTPHETVVEYEKAPDFNSSHFPEDKNTIVHYRVNDRTIDGKKTLFVEEVQSDWHQAGRKKGYNKPNYLDNRAKEYDVLKELQQNLYSKMDEFDKVVDDGGGYDAMLQKLGDKKYHELRNSYTEEARVKYDKQNDIVKGLESKIDAVPDAPFKKTWHELGMKHILRKAVEEGYDQVAFTTGEQQAERYDLSKQVDKINVEGIEEVDNLFFVDITLSNGETINLEVENGKVREGEFADKDLSDIVGKDLTKNILETKKGESRILRDSDLKVGGEGMKGFYDQMLPKYLNKFGKKFGARVGRGEVNGETVHTFPITDKMKASILEGQPLFQEDLSEIEKAKQMQKWANPKKEVKPKPQDEIAKLGLKKADVKIIRDFAGFEKLGDAETLSFAQAIHDVRKNNLQAKAQQLAVDIIDNPRILDAHEIVTLVVRKRELDTEIREAPKGSERERALMQEYDDITRASETSSPRGARAQSFRRLLLTEDFTPQANLSKARKKKGSQLTESEKTKIEELSEKAENYKTQLDKMYENYIKEKREKEKILAERITKLESRKASKRKTKFEKIYAERETLKNDLKDLGIRVNDLVGVTAEGYYKLGKYVNNYIKEAVEKTGENADLKDIIKAIQKDIPDISANDVYRALNTKKPSVQAKAKTEAQKKITLLKREARLKDKIRQLEDEVFNVTPPKKRIETEKLKRLDKLYRLLRSSAYETITDGVKLDKALTTLNELQDALDTHYRRIRVKRKPDPVELAEIKKKANKLRKQIRNEDLLSDLEEQLRTGVFEVPDKFIQEVYPKDLNDTEAKVRIARKRIKQYIDSLEPKTTKQKAVQRAHELRTMKATLDVSAAGRQAWLAMVDDPKQFGKNYFTALKGMINETSYETIQRDIENHPNQIIRDAAGLKINDIHNLGFKEEMMQGSKGLQDIKFMGYGKAIKASDRNMTVMLNLTRATMFDRFLKLYPNATMKELKSWADYVNITTGVGSIKAGSWSNFAFFAPRFSWSRIEYPYQVFKHWKEPRVRKEILKNFGKNALLGATILTLAGIAGAELTSDWQSPDFGKVKIGNTRIDVFAGVLQPTRLAFQLASILYDTASDGASKKNPIDLVSNFSKYKLSPAITLTNTLVTGKDMVGNKYTKLEALGSSVLPMVYEELADAYKDAGLTKTLWLTLPVISGIGTSTYNSLSGDIRRVEQNVSRFKDVSDKAVDDYKQNDKLANWLYRMHNGTTNKTEVKKILKLQKNKDKLTELELERLEKNTKIMNDAIKYNRNYRFPRILSNSYRKVVKK